MKLSMVKDANTKHSLWAEITLEDGTSELVPLAQAAEIVRLHYFEAELADRKAYEERRDREVLAQENIALALTAIATSLAERNRTGR